MAQIKCWDCGAQISSAAKKCPHCGAPRRSSRVVRWAIGLGLVAIPLLFAVANSWDRSNGVRQTPGSATVPTGGHLIIQTGTGPYSEVDVRRAVQEFRAICQPLGGVAWGDLRDIVATVEVEGADYRRAKGWKYHIELTAVIPDSPANIPQYINGLGVLTGHHLYFDLGAGNEPGVFISKRVGKYLCGIHDYDSGIDKFVPMPVLKFLDAPG